MKRMGCDALDDHMLATGIYECVDHRRTDGVCTFMHSLRGVVLYFSSAHTPFYSHQSLSFLLSLGLDGSAWMPLAAACCLMWRWHGDFK